MRGHVSPCHPELDLGSKFCKKSYINYGEFAIIKSKAGFDEHFINKKFSKSQRVEKLNKIAISKMRNLSGGDVKELEREIELRKKL